MDKYILILQRALFIFMTQQIRDGTRHPGQQLLLAHLLQVPAAAQHRQHHLVPVVLRLLQHLRQQVLLRLVQLYDS